MSCYAGDDEGYRTPTLCRDRTAHYHYATSPSGWPSGIRTHTLSVNSGVYYQLIRQANMKGSFHSSFHGSSKLVRIQSVRIELTASGVDAPLPSGAVERNRTVTLTLAMSGSTIKLQPHWSDARDSNSYPLFGRQRRCHYASIALVAEVRFERTEVSL